MANAISPLLEDVEPLEEVLNSYEESFWNGYYGMMGKKLGLDEVKKTDKELISQFEKVLSEVQPDMTLFYRLLAKLPSGIQEENIPGHFQECFYSELETSETASFKKLITDYSKRVKTNKISRETSAAIMNRTNPRIILRNFQLHQAIEELEKGENKLFLRLQEAMKDPYSTGGFENLVQKRPAWAETKAGCSMLSCSS